jgi:hypothetical protein
MSLHEIIEQRGKHAVAHIQAETFLLFGLALATDPEFRAEAERARAAAAGAIKPDETVELFKRTQGE